MNTQISPAPERARLTWLLAGGSLLVTLLLLTYWAGLPPADKLLLFVVGVLVLTASLGLFGWLFWHLMLRPLPAGQSIVRSTTLPATYRQVLALLIAISGLNVVVGGFWDEVWHRTYGIPFGQDLLWRPHLMLYLGFGIVSLLAFVGLYVIVKRGRGTLQQRFRADPVMGLLVLIGGFLVYALPVDPLWHIIYGEDISAWSIPHLVLFTSFTLIMLLATAIQLTTAPTQKWAMRARVGFNELLVCLTLAFALNITLQVLTTEWDVIQTIPAVRDSAFWARPVWLLPAIVSALTALFGVTAIHTLRRPGAAIITGLLALAVRAALVAAFGQVGITFNVWLVALLPMAALDIAFAWRIANQGRPLIWWEGGLAAWVGSGLSLWLIDRLLVYPDITVNTVPAMLAACLVTSLGAAWLGGALGDYLATANKQVEATPYTWVRLVPPIAGLGVLAFIILFIATATPPA